MNSNVQRLIHQLPRVVVIALSFLALFTIPALAQSYRMEVRADPPRLTFQPDSPDNNRVIIWVKVIDTISGLPAPDMTPVRFSTSLGVITGTAYVRNGELSAILENVQGPGRAKVDAQVEGGGISTVYVEYLGPGGIAVQASPVARPRYRLTSRQCYYSADKMIFDLRDEAKFESPGLTVTASAIQFDVRQRIVTAQFGVVVIAGKEQLQALRVRLDLNQNFGLAEMFNPEPCKTRFSLHTLKPEPDDGFIPCDPLDPQPTKSWIVCPEASIYPNDQTIQFRKPKFYVNKVDLPILKLPYHVLNYNQSQENTFFNLKADVTSDLGVNVDFPIYYAASANHIGSFHIRSFTKNNSPTGIAGLQYGIEEEYRLGNTATGVFYFDDLSRPTRSVSWDHSQTFGKMQVGVNASYERYSAKDPYTTRTTASISRPLGQVAMSLSGSFSQYKDQKSYNTLLSFYPPMLQLGKTKFGLSFNPYLAWQSSSGGTTTSQGGFSEGLSTSLGFPQIRFLGGSVYPTVSDGIAHFSDGNIVNNFDAGLRYQRQLFGSFIGSVGYTYNVQRSTKSTSVQPPASQRVDLSFSGNGRYWSCYGYSAYSLDAKSLYGAFNSTYYLPFDLSSQRERRLFLDYGASLSMINSDDKLQAEHIITLGRRIGSFTAMLHYSPTGNTSSTGIGLFTGKHWAFELMRNAW